MKDETDARGIQQPPEQLLYAHWLERGSILAAAVLTITFCAYLAGWLPPLISAEQLSGRWALPVAELNAIQQEHVRQSWIEQLHHGDMAALGGIALLASLSLPALLAVMIRAYKQADLRLAALCLVQVAVLVLAAAGWMPSGH